MLSQNELDVARNKSRRRYCFRRVDGIRCLHNQLSLFVYVVHDEKGSVFVIFIADIILGNVAEGLHYIWNVYS